MVACLIFIMAGLSSSLFLEAKFGSNRQQKAERAKAARPDAPAFDSVDFPVSCGGCAEQGCDIRAIGEVIERIEGDMLSSFDVVTSEIEALTDLEFFCCIATNSNIDALTDLQTSGFDVTTSLIDLIDNQACSCVEEARVDIVSDIDALTDLQTSGFDVTTSLIDLIDNQACSCVEEARVDIVSDIDALTDLQTSGFDVTTSLVDLIDGQVCSCVEEARVDIMSNVDALTNLQTSGFDVTTSLIDLIDNQACSCVEEARVDIMSNVDALTGLQNSSFDVVSSQIEALCTCCQFMITQNLIGSGGTYVIDTAGVYCLAQDIQFTTGPAITIEAPVDQVILDLNGHTITQFVDFRAPSTSAITVSNPSGAGSVIIRNGAISGCYMEITGSNNVIVQDLQINIPNGIGISITDSSNIFLKNLSMRDGVNDGIALINSSSVFLDSVSIYNCTGNGVTIFGSSDLVFHNVTSSGSFSGNGFLVNGATSFNITFKDCLAEGNEGYGFGLVTDPATGIIYSVLFENCLASDNTSGGFGASADLGDIDIVSISNVSYINCISRGQQGYGFFASGSFGFSTTVIKNLVYEGCQAFGATLSGFLANNQGIIIRNCIAEGNGENGIYLAGFSVNCQAIGNSCAQNGFTGITDSGSGNLVYSNVASGNGGANYGGSVPLRVLPNLTTSYWVNVDPSAP